MDLKNKLCSFLQNLMLSHPRMRVHAIEIIKNKYFSDLNLEVPTDKGIRQIPLIFSDSIASFSEIFVNNEYGWMDKTAHYNKWMDIGCNNGFFTLNLLQNLTVEDTKVEALLIDGDSRSRKSVDALKKKISANAQLQFVHGAVGPDCDFITFACEEAMLGHIAKSNDELLQTKQEKVEVIPQDKLLKLLSPPYDLIKVDIEGAEVMFLKNYQEVISNSNAMIIEWHSWNEQGCSLEDFRSMLHELGFTSEVKSLKEFELKGEAVSCADIFCVNQNKMKV